MNWKRVKKADEVALTGVTIATDRSDTSLLSVTITDANGKQIRVRLDSYSLYLEVPAPPKMVDKVGVTGKIVGVDVVETFDDNYSAEQRKREIESAGGSAEITSVQVEDDIPF